MTELDLYKFITKNKVEWHFINKKSKDEDVIVFIDNHLTPDWNKLLGSHITAEEGLECIMKDGYFCFHMNDICNYHGIDYSTIFIDE